MRFGSPVKLRDKGKRDDVAGEKAQAEEIVVGGVDDELVVGLAAEGACGKPASTTGRPSPDGNSRAQSGFWRSQAWRKSGAS